MTGKVMVISLEVKARTAEIMQAANNNKDLAPALLRNGSKKEKTERDSCMEPECFVKS